MGSDHCALVLAQICSARFEIDPNRQERDANHAFRKKLRRWQDLSASCLIQGKTSIQSRQKEGATPEGAQSQLARRRRLAAWVAREIVPHEARLRSRLARARVSPEDIDEIMQEAYCRIAMLSSVDNIDRPLAYMFAITRNLLLRRLKRQQIVRLEAISEIETWPDDGAPSPEDQAASRLSYERVLAIIARLPERCRTVIELRKIEGRSQKEIAAHLGMTEKAVEKQVWVGVRAIRQAWMLAEARSEELMSETERKEARSW